MRLKCIFALPETAVALLVVTFRLGKIELRVLKILLCPNVFLGFPILNTFTSASVSPANHRDQGSDGSSGDSRCCPGCLGRNSIAKAASAVGPAVVNISSMHGEDILV